MVVVTKCPREIRSLDVRLIYEHLGLFAYQKVYFSHYIYGGLVSVFPDEVRYMPDLKMLGADDSILIVSGIANPKPLVRYLRSFGSKVYVKRYPDHHNFSRKDFDDIKKAYGQMSGKYKYIVTTEKDAVRIANSPYYPHELKASTFYLPIKVEFLPHKMPLGCDSFEKELRSLINRQVDNG